MAASKDSRSRFHREFSLGNFSLNPHAGGNVPFCTLMKTLQTSRRRFLKGLAATSAVATIGFPAITRAASPGSKLNLAGVGVGGKGAGDIAETAVNNNVVAICDVDDRTLQGAGQKYPGAKKYHDWRKLLEQKDVDGVTVSTPDHMHAPIALAAMQLGKHVYVQKPLSHTIFESRVLTKAARKYKVVTQMGNQNHSGTGYRSLVEAVRIGAIGKVKEAHAWSNRPIWPQGIPRPQGSDPVPDYLKWDLWLGVAKERPFVDAKETADKDGKKRRTGRGPYHPFNWRGFVDFGVGALGDMGCHIIDPVFWSLDLEAPEFVWYEGEVCNGETFPSSEIIHYKFKKSKYTKGDITMTWYDGGKKPSLDLMKLPEGQKLTDNGCLLIGEYGSLLCPHGGKPQLLPADRFAEVKLEEVPGDNHYQQWANACKGEGKATGDFDYSGPLTETVLLGTVAIYFPGQKLEWDSKKLEFKNSKEATQRVHHSYRAGWEMEGLTRELAKG